METKIAGFSSVLGIFLLFACFLQTEAAFDPKSFQLKLSALDKILTYINDRTKQMNVDVTYGVTLSQVNLIAALNNDNIQYLGDEFFIFLKHLLILSDVTRRNLMNNVVPRSEIELSLQSRLNNVTLWMKPIWWMRIFPKNKPTLNLRLNYEQVIESIQHGWPNELNSDQCLFQIIQSGLNKECKIPQTCTEGLIKHDNATGYSLTHRLLIIQTAQRFGCQEIASLPPFSYFVHALCARIFQDLVNLEAWGFPYFSQDLMIEQIILCGMEGYYEFLDKHYEDLILSWLRGTECFKLPIMSEKLRRIPRASSSTDSDCNNHMTSLGAASLALFIRENIENELGP